MKVDKDTLKKIAHLSRVEIDPKDEKGLLKDLEQIVSWVEKLDSLDTKGIEPLRHMTMEKNRLRPDEAENTLAKDKALENAPEHDQHFFRVPKVLK